MKNTGYHYCINTQYLTSGCERLYMRKYHCIDYVEFGKRIARQRKRQGMSQSQLAERLDCNESYISKIEKAKSKPTLDFIFLLTKEFGVGIDDLLPFTPVNSVIMKTEIQERWERCSPEMIKFLNAIIDAAEQFEKDVELRKGDK